jgi:hypothetical protein
MAKRHYERTDYSVVVKNRAPPPKVWRWEIYRVGNANPIKQSSIYFDTTAAARRAGKRCAQGIVEQTFQLIACHRGREFNPASGSWPDLGASQRHCRN